MRPFRKIEKKWEKRWLEEKTYEADLERAKQPFYNLMMFPYPSAEGLHVGNMYAFTGSDIYGRFQRMKGKDVFEPIGLDGFGIHSENYALKIGAHPAKQAKISEKRFYRQLQAIGNGFDWSSQLETYDPQYYRWTQWIFLQLFKQGLAYRQKSPVNWCPSCKTVLADEQVVDGACERCNSSVIKKELEQWFFRITDYAEKLLKNLDKIDWSEKVKIAQKNWIGKSEGMELEFEITGKRRFVLLHGYQGDPTRNFFPWLGKELQKRGHVVIAPKMPKGEYPNIQEQIEYVKKRIKLDENTVLLGHSLGAVVAMKAVESLSKPIHKLILAGGFAKPKFEDHSRSFEGIFDWKFNFAKIKRNAPDIRILHDINDKVVSLSRVKELRLAFGKEPILFEAESMHICGKREPVVLKNCVDSLKVFTTRIDTLFGTTYLVLSPEHPFVASLLKIKNQKSKIKNIEEVEKYIADSKKKSDLQRTDLTKEKTGVELKGIKAINPANQKELPVWVADYVLASYGTGAIMAVPAHDQRDFEFAKRYKLPIVEVIASRNICVNPRKSALNEVYEGEGILINSKQFNGLDSKKAKQAIANFVKAEKKNQYHLRDWLISRQRYWGPPIPLIFCENCKKLAESSKFKIQSSKLRKKFSKGELENPGWIAVQEKGLPVKLPFIKNFQPKGKGVSPLAAVKSFYEVKCPKCGEKARRETDVSDTFLDSSWYYIGYLIFKNQKSKTKNQKFVFNKKHWLPVDMYIGGAEHSVLHLLYARFITMVLKDIKFIDFEEPFSMFRAHGLIIKEGAKMSKSKGNIVNPDEYIEKFGADALRLHLMFIGPFEEGGDFRDQAIVGVVRFLNRVWKFGSGFLEIKEKQAKNSLVDWLHLPVKKISEDIAGLRYNTAIAELMIILNNFEKNPRQVKKGDWEVFLKLLAPFAPFITEELWEKLGCKNSIHLAVWPEHDEKLIQKKTIEFVIQVNGRVRDKFEIESGAKEESIKSQVLEREKIKRFIIAKKIKKIIFVAGKLINIVTD